MKNNKPITEARFFDSDRYRPIQNPRTDGSWGGAFHETFGDDLATVRKAEPAHRVWTLVETDGQLAIIAGMHFVNRLGYFITEVPWGTGEEEVEIDKE